MQRFFLGICCLFSVAVGNQARFRASSGFRGQQATLSASPESINLSPSAWPQLRMGSSQTASIGNIANPSQKSQDDQDDIMKEATDEFHLTFDKFYHMDPVKMVKEDIKLFMDSLLPGKRPDLKARKADGVFVLVAIVWFVIYYQLIFQTDRADSIDRWNNVKRHPIHSGFEMQPDLVLVFHHPEHNYSDSEKLVSQNTLLQALVSCRENDERSNEFARTLSLRQRASARQSLFTPPRPGSRSRTPTDPDKPSVNLRHVRAALLQDLYQALADENAGFFMDAFTSVDGDEIHVCVSLHSAKTIRRHLEWSAMKLKLQKGIVKDKLGIGQPENEEESSSPYVQYSEALSQLVLGSNKSDFDLFQVYGKSATKSGRGTIISGQQRIQLVYKYLNNRLDLDFAVNKGLLVQWFPAHHTDRLSDLQACWARWGLLLDFTFMQPLTFLNDYFSSRVTFIFAWAGHHCKLLLAITPVAIAFELANLRFWHHGSVFAFGFIVAGWGQWAMNSWLREQEYFCTLWDLNESHKDKSRRADFKGTLSPSQVDSNVEDLYCSVWESIARLSVSWLVTAIAVAVNLITLVCWIDLWQGRMQIGAILVQSLIVQTFTAIFNWMGEALTTAENHKYQENYYNSYLSKMILFQFANQYSPYFYIAMKQQFTNHGCRRGDCIWVIRSQLPWVLACLSAMRVLHVVWATFRVEFELWRESRALIRAGGEQPNYCYLEKQSKFGKFRIRQQIEVMTQLTVTLGYVLIFGAIVPGIIPLCFLVFAVQLRADAITVTTATNRTVPRVSPGIGVWTRVVEILQVVGIVFSGFLLVMFEPLFDGTAALTKLSCMCFFCGILLVSCKALDTLVPRQTHQAEILQDRRDYSARKLREFAERKMRENTKSKWIREESTHSKNVHCCSEIRNAEWSKIPRANDSVVRSKSYCCDREVEEEDEEDPSRQERTDASFLSEVDN